MEYMRISYCTLKEQSLEFQTFEAKTALWPEGKSLVWASKYCYYICRYVIQETAGHRVTFYFRSPREGNYYLTVFAQQVGDRIRVENVFKAVRN